MNLRVNPKDWVRALEDWWFDTTRHVRTSGVAVPAASDVIGDPRDGKMYAPVRARRARAAIRSLGLRDLSSCTFIDMGSGRGRALFIAAEFPFREVVGVEYSAALHAAAEENIRRFRYTRRQCSSIRSIAANAAEYDFPPTNLVVFLFNPFGPQVLRSMLANLTRSLAETPRHALLVMLWPEHGDVVAGTAGVRPVQIGSRLHIYEMGSAPAA